MHWYRNSFKGTKLSLVPQLHIFSQSLLTASTCPGARVVPFRSQWPLRSLLGSRLFLVAFRSFSQYARLVTNRQMPSWTNTALVTSHVSQPLLEAHLQERIKYSTWKVPTNLLAKNKQSTFFSTVSQYCSVLKWPASQALSFKVFPQNAQTLVQTGLSQYWFTGVNRWSTFTQLTELILNTDNLLRRVTMFQETWTLTLQFCSQRFSIHSSHVALSCGVIICDQPH